MATILVIEDDIDISQGIAEYLSTKGHELDFAYNGRQALSLIEANYYDLILLDLNLPYVDGLDVCRSMLTEYLTVVPVIIMSARSKESDVLKGFDSGAWDYLAKPFSFAELSARISVCLAKNEHLNTNMHLIEKAGIRLNRDDLTLSIAEHSMQLHQVGFELVKLLLEQYPGAVKTATIHRQIWGEETPESDPLRAHVYKIRKQLKAQFGHELIATVRGVGYKLSISESDEG